MILRPSKDDRNKDKSKERDSGKKGISKAIPKFSTTTIEISGAKSARDKQKLSEKTLKYYNFEEAAVNENVQSFIVDLDREKVNTAQTKEHEVYVKGMQKLTVKIIIGLGVATACCAGIAIVASQFSK